MKEWNSLEFTWMEAALRQANPSAWDHQALDPVFWEGPFHFPASQQGWPSAGLECNGSLCSPSTHIHSSARTSC